MPGAVCEFNALGCFLRNQYSEISISLLAREGHSQLCHFLSVWCKRDSSLLVPQSMKWVQ